MNSEVQTIQPQQELREEIEPGKPFILESGFQKKLKPEVMYRFVRLYEKIAVAEYIDVEDNEDVYQHSDLKQYLMRQEFGTKYTAKVARVNLEADSEPETSLLDAGLIQLSSSGTLRVWAYSWSVPDSFGSNKHKSRATTLNCISSLSGLEPSYTPQTSQSDVQIAVPH